MAEWEAFDMEVEARVKEWSKKWNILHYFFLLAIISLAISAFWLVNNYLSLVSPGNTAFIGSSAQQMFRDVGYPEYLLILLLSPVPDYIIVTAGGYASSLGDYNPFVILLISTVAMAFLLQGIYYSTRLGGRPLVMRIMKYFRISDKGFESSEKWIKDHGAMSVFAISFVPYVTIPMALASGMLAMKQSRYLLANIAGLGSRYALLVASGYFGVDILTESLKRTNLPVFAAAAALSAIYVAVYFTHSRRMKKEMQPLSD